MAFQVVYKNIIVVVELAKRHNRKSECLFKFCYQR